MQTYNDKYDKIIAPMYGPIRNLEEDANLMSNNVLPSKYAITNRVDMTKYDTYSVDPDGCEDADDAFSIYEEDGKLFLAIHIADPTEYINIESLLWRDIEKRVVTRYPSNKTPIHMMPSEIMEKSSLMVNKYGDIKFAITILTEINRETYRPVGNIQLLFTTVRVVAANSLSYCVAGVMAETNSTITHGLNICLALQEMRGERTKGIVLNDICSSYPKRDKSTDLLYLYSDTPTEKLMKQMIAEFAIFANSFVGEYLKIHFHGVGLYRICAAKEWLNTVYEDITGQELLNEIIANGIKAEYISTVSSHDLVGSPEYCHFTSPIRRLSDCVCHYLLKYIHLQNSVSAVPVPALLVPALPVPVPFSNDQLKSYSNDCVKLSKLIKNTQYKDTKFRLVQTIHDMLCNNEDVELVYYVGGYIGIYLNIIVCNINTHSIYMSYTLQRQDLQTEFVAKERHTLKITKTKCLGKFDEGSLPELDVLFM